MSASGPAHAARTALEAVREQLRAVPDSGMSWGLLRYLNPGTAPALAALPVPDVRFNYLGRFTATGTAGGELLAGGDESVPLRHTLEVDALAHERSGALRLEATFSYPQGVLTEQEACDLADSWADALELN
ncbi:hypothetical protein GXW82_04460 [Streptacidiphilus sp. 4-A2]|nr:hypothetical protein [Streptacidiphilus sp. 4-A2]